MLTANCYPAIHPQHSKYNTQRVEHEAGYDSLLTAQVFVRLSAQLRDGRELHPDPPSSADLPHQISHQRAAEWTRSEIHRGSTRQDIPIIDSHRHHRGQNKHGLPQPPQADVLGTRFDLLEVEEIIDSLDSNIPIDDRRLSLAPSNSPEIMRKVNSGELIPRLSAEFWKVYGNKLRVFGTLERVCIMGS